MHGRYCKESQCGFYFFELCRLSSAKVAQAQKLFRKLAVKPVRVEGGLYVHGGHQAHKKRMFRWRQILNQVISAVCVARKFRKYEIEGLVCITLFTPRLLKNGFGAQIF